MIHVTLKGGVVRQYEDGATAMDVAKSLGAGLYKAACACKIDGALCDLRTALPGDCALSILTFDDAEGKRTFWHTASHIMAQAVKRLYPQAKLTIGPAVDNGFYYDFDAEEPFTPESLAKIEAEMKKIVKIVAIVVAVVLVAAFVAPMLLRGKIAQIVKRCRWSGLSLRLMMRLRLWRRKTNPIRWSSSASMRRRASRFPSTNRGNSRSCAPARICRIQAGSRHSS